MTRTPQATSAGVHIAAGIVTQVFPVRISVPRGAALVPAETQATFLASEALRGQPCEWWRLPGPEPLRTSSLFMPDTLRWVSVQLG